MDAETIKRSKRHNFHRQMEEKQLYHPWEIDKKSLYWIRKDLSWFDLRSANNVINNTDNMGGPKIPESEIRPKILYQVYVEVLKQLNNCSISSKLYTTLGKFDCINQSQLL